MSLLATNLATNPSFEDSDGPIALFTNLATNPSFQTSPDPTTRTNLCPNPSFEKSTTYWYGGFNSTVSISNVHHVFGSNALLINRNNANVGSSYAKLFMNVTAGEIYTVSFYILGNGAGYSFKDVNGTSTPFLVSSTAWNRVSFTFTVAATGNNKIIYITDDNNTAPVKGQQTWIDGVLIETGSTLRPYFDGSFTGSGWVGATNGSASIQTFVQPVPIRRNLHPNPAATQISTDWTAMTFGTAGGAGTHTFHTASGLTAGAGLTYGPDTYVRKQWTTAAPSPQDTGLLTLSTVSGRGIQVTPGQVISASGWVRYSSVNSKSNWVLRTYWYNASGAGLQGASAYSDGTVQSSITQNTWTRLVSNGITVPAGAAYGVPALTLQGAGGGAWAVGDWLDGTGLTFEVAPYAGPYFTGTSTSDFTVDWDGLPGNDASSITGTPVTGVASGANSQALGATSWRAQGGQSVRVTALTSSRDSYADISALFSSYAWLPSTTYTLQATRNLTAPQAAAAAALPPFKVNFGGSDLTLTYTVAATNVAGAYQIVATFTTPSGTPTLAYLRLYSNAAAGEPDIFWDNVLLTPGTYSGAYFDGDTTPTGDLTYSWTDTPNSSSSVQAVGSITAVDGGINALVYQSTAWAAQSTRSARISPAGASNASSSLGIGGDTGALQMGMQPNQTYTVMATFEQAAPQTGTLHALARSIVAYFKVGGTVTTQQVQATNTAGSQQLTMTFTVPVNATEAYIRLFNGAALGGGDVFWDDFLLVQGTYTGPYFDGSTPAYNGTKYSWTGVANKSTTTAYGADSAMGLELTVYDAKNPANAIGILPRAANVAVMEEVSNGNGSGTFDILQNDSVFTDTPTICSYRNLVRVSTNGQVTDAFLIQNAVKTQQPADAGGEYVLTYSGEGLLSWFNDAVLYPEGGLKADTYSTRYFNFGSQKGSTGWYKPNQWKAPVTNGAYNPTQPQDFTTPWKGAPANWPPQGKYAEWIWSQAYNKSPGVPAGENFFRYEFTTAAEAAVTLYITADDYFEAFIDSQQIVAAYPGSWRETYSATVTIPAGAHVLAVRGVNVAGPASILAALFYAADAAGNLGSLITHTGNATTGHGWTVCAYPTQTPGWTAGALMLQLLSEAQARGVLFPTFIKPSFTALVDSNGVPWAQTLNWNFTVGTSYMNIVRTVESMGFEMAIDPVTLVFSMWPVRGADRSVPINGSDAVVLSTGLNLVQADGSAQASIINSMVVQTNEGFMESVNAASQTTWGRIEGSSSLTGTKAQGQALAAQTMNIQALPMDGATYTIAPVPGAIPDVDFFTGDYVKAPDSTGVLQKRRVMSITKTPDSAGNPTYVVEFDTIFQEISARLADWVAQLQGNTTAAGSNTTLQVQSGSPTSVPSKTPTNTAAASTWVPTAPQNLVPFLTPAWDSTGNTLCVTDLSWDPVLTNVDGSPSQVLGYEVWGQNMSAATNTPQVLAQVSVPSVELSTLQWGATYAFQIRAIGTNGVFSDFSAQLTVPLVPAIPVLDAPTTPLVTGKMGQVQVSWDGNLLQSAPYAPPLRFDHITAQISPTQTGTYQNIGSNLVVSGTITLSNLIVGSTYWVQLIAYDKQGNVSAASIPVSVTVPGVALTEVDNTITDAITAASNIAKSKNAIYYQSAAPTIPVIGAAFVVDDIWFDTSQGYAPNHWDGTQWVASAFGTGALAAGSVTAAQIAAHTITAGQIAAGTITASEIAAGSITSKNLTIGDFTNLADGSNFEIPANNPWVLGTAWTLDTTQHNDGTTSLRCTGSSSGVATLSSPLTGHFGDQWYYEFYAYIDAAWNGTATGSMLQFQNQSGTVIATAPYGSTNLPVATWTKVSGTFTVPVGTTSIPVTLLENATAGNIWIDDIIIRRRNEGALIVDGTITGSKLVAGAIDGLTITGATLQTASSGQRVVIDTSGLKGYNSTGTVITQISTTTGALTATGATITGTVQTGTTGQRAVMSGTGLTMYSPNGATSSITGSETTISGVLKGVLTLAASAGGSVYIGTQTGYNSSTLVTDSAQIDNIFWGPSSAPLPVFYFGTFADSTIVAAGGNHNTTITFPTGYFPGPPTAVLVTAGNARFTAAVSSITTTSAVVSMSNWSTAAGSPGTCSFVAFIAGGVVVHPL